MANDDVLALLRRQKAGLRNIQKEEFFGIAYGRPYYFFIDFTAQTNDAENLRKAEELSAAVTNFFSGRNIDITRSITHVGDVSHFATDQTNPDEVMLYTRTAAMGKLAALKFCLPQDHTYSIEQLNEAVIALLSRSLELQPTPVPGGGNGSATAEFPRETVVEA